MDMNEEMTKTNHDFNRGLLLAGPPTSWVPPGVYPSQNLSLSKLEPPTSTGKGRGGSGWISRICAGWGHR